MDWEKAETFWLEPKDKYYLSYLKIIIAEHFLVLKIIFMLLSGLSFSTLVWGFFTLFLYCKTIFIF